MRRSTLFGFIVALCSLSLVCNGKTQDAAPDEVNWKLVFEDNFDGTAVNNSEWSMYNGAGHVGNGVRRPEAFSVADGLLVITAQMKDGQLVSGGMAHRKNYQYGRFEFRVRTEADPSQATSGVVLTWPQNENWPADGELDIYETATASSRNPFHTFIHYGADNRQTHFIHNADGTAWQTMMCEWLPDVIRIYRNGQVVYTLTDKNAIPQVAHHLSIQLDAFKTTMTGSVKMYVDWIKVYQPASPGYDPNAFSDASKNVNPNEEAWPIPGKIEAEHFDFGGEGVAYHDSDVDNHSSLYRQTESVELFSCTSYGGSGYNIGYIAAGEWWKYTVNVMETGTYKLSVNASSQSGGSFTVKVGDNSPVQINVNTGNYNTYRLVEAPATLNLQAGKQTVRVTSNGSHNLDYYLFEKTTASKIPSNPLVSEIYYDRTTASIQTGNATGILTITDIYGRTLLKQSFFPNETIGTNGLTKGVYLLHFAGKTVKFVK